ncbi:MAG TPA: hypothetical protein VHG92_12965 [Afifellaceae bacterium]|nr:hypothetical protein [Afifellaceae bacterium]
MALLSGACHCGAVAVSLQTADPEGLQLRACQCSFCRRHGVVSASDHAGRLTIRAMGDGLTRYRFGLKTADFLFCSVCGTYVAATIAMGAEVRAIVNAIGTQLEGITGKAATPVDYEDEGQGERVARRLAQWMPVSLIEEPGRAHA